MPAADEDFEDDFVVRFPPQRRYRVQLNILRVRKGEPEIVGGDFA